MRAPRTETIAAREADATAYAAGTETLPGAVVRDLDESTYGHATGVRHFTYWPEAPLREVLDAAGWHDVFASRP